jgi:hypothetical protein
MIGSFQPAAGTEARLGVPQIMQANVPLLPAQPCWIVGRARRFGAETLDLPEACEGLAPFWGISEKLAELGRPGKIADQGSLTCGR